MLRNPSRSSQVWPGLRVSVESSVAVASSLCLGLVLVRGVGVDALSVVVRLKDVLRTRKSVTMQYKCQCWIPLVCKSGTGRWGKQQPAEAAGMSAAADDMLAAAAGRPPSVAAAAAGRSAA